MAKSFWEKLKEDVGRVFNKEEKQKQNKAKAKAYNTSKKTTTYKAPISSNVTSSVSKNTKTVNDTVKQINKITTKKHTNISSTNKQTSSVSSTKNTIPSNPFSNNTKSTDINTNYVDSYISSIKNKANEDVENASKVISTDKSAESKVKNNNVLSDGGTQVYNIKTNTDTIKSGNSDKTTKESKIDDEDNLQPLVTSESRQKGKPKTFEEIKENEGYIFKSNYSVAPTSLNVATSGFNTKSQNLNNTFSDNNILSSSNQIPSYIKEKQAQQAQQKKENKSEDKSVKISDYKVESVLPTSMNQSSGGANQAQIDQAQTIIKLQNDKNGIGSEFDKAKTARKNNLEKETKLQEEEILVGLSQTDTRENEDYDKIVEQEKNNTNNVLHKMYNSGNADYLLYADEEQLNDILYLSATNEDLMNDYIKLNRPQWEERKEAYKDVQNGDYEKYVTKGKNVESNNQGFLSENTLKDIQNSSGMLSEKIGYMSEEETNYYYYLLGKYKENPKKNAEYKDKAKQYLKTLLSAGTYRQGEEEYLEHADDNAVERSFYDAKTAIFKGGKDFGKGLMQWGSNLGGSSYILDDYDASDVVYNLELQRLQGLIDEKNNIISDPNKQQENQNKVGEFLYKAVPSTTDNALRMATAAFLGPGVGTGLATGLTFASVYGNSYKDLRLQGYSHNQADISATTSGISEVVTEKLIGGMPYISKGKNFVGKGVVNTLGKVSAKIADSKVARNIIQSGVDEFTEEYIQSAVVDPLNKRFILGDENAEFFSKESLEEGLMGAFSGMILTGATSPITINSRNSLDSSINSNIEYINSLGTNKIETQKDFIDNIKTDSTSGLRAYEAGKGLSKGTFKELYTETELNNKFGPENTKQYLNDLKTNKDSNFIKTIEDFRLKKNKQINNEDIKIRENILTDNKGNIIGLKNNNIDTNNQVQSFNQSTDKIITNEYTKQNISNELPYRFTDNINQSYVNNVKDNITMILDTDVRGYDFSLKEGSVDALINDKTNNITKNDISKISNMLAHYDVMEKNGPGINIIKQVGNDTYTLGLLLDTNEQRIVVTDYRKVRDSNTNNILPLKNKNSSSNNIEQQGLKGYNNTKGEIENERIQTTLSSGRNEQRTSEGIFESNKQQKRLGYDGRGTSQQSSSRRNNKRREYKGSESLRESFLLRQSSKNGKEIRRIVENAKENNPMGCCVDIHSKEEYDTYKNFVLPDNMGNVSVKPDGDIVSVVKNSNSKIKGALQIFMNTAIENGGIKLDCYGKLAEYYAPYGFEAVARVEFNEEYAPDDWNYEVLGKPYVYVMRYNPNIDTKNQDLESVRTFNKDQYDEAIAYRDSLIENETPREGVFFNDKNTEETDTEKLLKQVKQMQEEMKRQQEEYTKQINNMQKEIDNLKSGTVSNNKKRKGSAYTNDNKQIDFEYDIVNIKDLITSHDTEGNINNNYPQKLQPRDRQRDASYEQIRSIAANLNPSRLMASSNVTDGAPIIGNDNVVESGNGRVIALNLAMQNYIQNMSDYQNYLNEHKSEYGFDDRDIKLGDILVRRRTSEVNREDFVRKANESTISTLNATEQAKIDAEKLSDEVLNMFVANDEGIIQTNDNENFIKAFVYNVIPGNEKNSFIDINGNLTKEGITRIENAIFAKAYNMDETLISRLAETTNDDARNISKALLMAASNTVKIKQGINNSEYYNLDFSEDIAKGAKLYLELKTNKAYKNTNAKVDLYINQTSLIDDNISPEAKAISYVFEQLKTSPVKINEFITSMYDIIREIGSPNQVSLLGSKEYTKGDIIRYGEIAFNKQSGQSLEARLRYEKSRGVSENDGQQKQASEEEIKIAKYIADKVNSKKLEKKKAVKSKNINISKAQDNTGAFLNEKKVNKKEKIKDNKKQSNAQDISAIYANQRYIFDNEGNIIRIERIDNPFTNTFDNEVFKANAIESLPLPTPSLQEDVENSWKIKGSVKLINKINDIVGKEVIKGNMSKEDAITYFSEFDKLGQALVNDGYYIEKFGKDIKNNNFKLYYNSILHSYKAAETCLGAFQVDHKGKRVGESVYKVLEPVMDRIDDFNDYLHHRLNIDRWKTGKQLDDNVSAMDSLSIVQRYESENSDFKLAAQKVYNYIRKINDMYIDAGISTRERQNMLEELYPNYVPLMYKKNPFDTKINKSNISTSTTVTDPVRKAKGRGGFDNLESIDVVLARMTVGAHKKVRLNELFKEFYSMFEEGKTRGLVDVRKIGDIDINDLDGEISQVYNEMISVENGDTFNFYQDGLKFQIALEEHLAESILKLNQGDRGSLYENIGAVGLKKAVNVFKQLQTSWKPSFILRNFARDFTDSLWYTDSLKDYLKTTPKAVQEVYKGLFTKKGSKYWDLYESLGGISNSYFEDGIFHMKKIKGTSENRSRINRALNTIPDLNLMVEQIPRMTEFIKTLERAGFNENNLSKLDYNTAVDALWNADDITLNFGRGSQFVRAANRYAIPFLNPTVQGSAKFFRHISDNFSKGIATGLGQFITRVAIYGVPVGLANKLIKMVIESLYDDDDEEKKKMQEAYDNLTDYNKNSNFLIYKGDGQFNKIPKGRIVAGITTIGGDAYKAIFKGEDIDIRESLGFMLEQINPMNINFIWDPLVQAKNNKNYFGGDIESDFMQELPVNERYDENTDEISKFIANTPLGKALNLSPKKVNYVIDQYSGVGGELILPFFTQSGLIGGEDNAKDWLKNTASTTWKNMWSPLTVDTAYSNKYSSEYAELKEKINQESTSEYRNKKYVDKNGKTLTTPTYLKSKMFDNVDKEIAQLYQEQSKIYNDDNLTNQEKSEKLREISLQINQKKKDMVNLYNQVSPLLDKEYKNNKSKYTKSQKSSYELYDALNNILVNKIGSDASCEMAINFIYSDENNKSHVKMQQQIALLKNNGISYKDIASYFVYANDVQYTPKSEIGDKQNALLKKVNSLNLSKKQKALLLFSTPSWTDRYNDNEILNRYEVKGGQLGYSTTYEAREDVANYIINANHLSQKQKLEMAELAGFEIGEDEGGKYIKW